jgi:3D (Asp-Asp-Asp) domain-containing protein
MAATRQDSTAHAMHRCRGTFPPRARRGVLCVTLGSAIALPPLGSALAGTAVHGTGTLRFAMARDTSNVINVGQTYKTEIEATCYDSSGNMVTDTVTLSVVSGAPDTGNASVTFKPNPIQTFVEGDFIVKTTTQTDANVYSIVVTGNGPACGQYGTATFPLTVNPILSLARQDLLTIIATGNPTMGGSFDYVTTTDDGVTIAPLAMASGVTATTNPNTTTLSDPANPSPNGAPSQGGLGKYQVNFSQNGLTAMNDKKNPFKVPVFGMSCYYTTLESDWGTQPDHCLKVRIHGTTYTGTVTDPYGYAGTYCSSFIAEVVLQGSGVTNGGTDIQYNNGTIVAVTSINGADGTPVVAGQTVARSRSVIPGRGVLVDVDSVGTGLLANDTGGAIVGYRLDLYEGAGKGVCAGYANPMGVSDCSPAQTKCPGSALQ